MDRLEARKSLHTCLCQAVGINTWEEACKVYPEVSNKIEELVVKNILFFLNKGIICTVKPGLSDHNIHLMKLNVCHNHFQDVKLNRGQSKQNGSYNFK